MSDAGACGAGVPESVAVAAGTRSATPENLLDAGTSRGDINQAGDVRHAKFPAQDHDNYAVSFAGTQFYVDHLSFAFPHQHRKRQGLDPSRLISPVVVFNCTPDVRSGLLCGSLETGRPVPGRAGAI